MMMIIIINDLGMRPTGWVDFSDVQYVVESHLKEFAQDAGCNWGPEYVS